VRKVVAWAVINVEHCRAHQFPAIPFLPMLQILPQVMRDYGKGEQWAEELVHYYNPIVIEESVL